jgi:hypothetical protein
LRNDDSIANSDRENYHVASEQICIVNLFLNNFIKTVNFFFENFGGWMRISDG